MRLADGSAIGRECTARAYHCFEARVLITGGPTKRLAIQDEIDCLCRQSVTWHSERGWLTLRDVRQRVRQWCLDDHET
jgi:hypothetical protein